MHWCVISKESSEFGGLRSEIYLPLAQRFYWAEVLNPLGPPEIRLPFSSGQLAT